MKLATEPYRQQVRRWTASGRHILAQFDEESVVVYQAYRPEIGRFAAEHGDFGGAFRLRRMSWIKPNFLWMMYRVEDAPPGVLATDRGEQDGHCRVMERRDDLGEGAVQLVAVVGGERGPHHGKAKAEPRHDLALSDAVTYLFVRS